MLSISLIDRAIPAPTVVCLTDTYDRNGQEAVRIIIGPASIQVTPRTLYTLHFLLTSHVAERRRTLEQKNNFIKGLSKV